jgi:hypothetical protein
MDDVRSCLDIDPAVTGRPFPRNQREALAIISFADLDTLAGGYFAEKRALAHDVPSATHAALWILVNIDLECTVADSVAIDEDRAGAADGAYPVHHGISLLLVGAVSTSDLEADSCATAQTIRRQQGSIHVPATLLFGGPDAVRH